MAENQLMVIDCHARLRADFLCEINFKPDLHSQPAHRPHISLPVPVKTASDISGMIECNDHHTTWQLIGCDFRSGAKSSPGSTACPQLSLDLDSAPSRQFPCRDNSGCVPYILVCDHRQDCDDGSDEDFCVYQPCTSTQSVCRDEKQVCLPTRTCVASYNSQTYPAVMTTLVLLLLFLYCISVYIHKTLLQNICQPHTQMKDQEIQFNYTHARNAHARACIHTH